MYSTSILVAALAAAAPALAAPKINAYWGQHGTGSTTVDPDTLGRFCAETSLDYVTLAFVNKSPEHGKGYPGTNFGSHCNFPTYPAPNSADGSSYLQSDCSFIRQDIEKCHNLGKKVLLSIGGEFSEDNSNYDISGQAAAEDFADFLLGAFGPYSADFTGPRPFDFDGKHISVDGFDFDIEKSYANQAGGNPYIYMANHMRAQIEQRSLGLIMTAAPECPTNSFAKILDLVQGAKFDKLFIQFYNNPSCDSTGPQFNFNDWVSKLQGTASQDAELFVGLPAAPNAAGSGFNDGDTLKTALCSVKKNSHFGGVSLFDASYAEEDYKGGAGPAFYDVVYSILNGGCPGDVATTTSSTATSTSTSTTSTSTSTTSSTTSMASTTTTTSSSTTSSATSTATSTTTSSTSSVTSTASATSTSVYSTTTTSSTSTAASSTSTTSSTSSTSTYGYTTGSSSTMTTVATTTQTSTSSYGYYANTTSSSIQTTVATTSSTAPGYSTSLLSSTQSTVATTTATSGNGYYVNSQSSIKSTVATTTATSAQGYYVNSLSSIKSTVATTTATSAQGYYVNSLSSIKSTVATTTPTSAQGYYVNSQSSIKSTVATTSWTTKTTETCYTSTVMTTKVTTISQGSYVTQTVPLYTTTITVTKTFATIVETKPVSTAVVYATGGPKGGDEHVYNYVSVSSSAVAYTSNAFPTSSVVYKTSVVAYTSNAFPTSSMVYKTSVVSPVSYPTGGSKGNGTSSGYATPTGSGYKTTSTPVAAGSAKTMAFSLGGVFLAAAAAVMAL